MAASLAASIPAVGSSSTNKSCGRRRAPAPQDALLLSSREIPEHCWLRGSAPSRASARRPASRSAWCTRSRGPALAARPISTTSSAVTGRIVSMRSRCGTS